MRTASDEMTSTRWAKGFSGLRYVRRYKRRPPNTNNPAASDRKVEGSGMAAAAFRVVFGLGPYEILASIGARGNGRRVSRPRSFGMCGKGASATGLFQKTNAERDRAS